MEESSFAALPDELIEYIICNLPPRDTLAFGATCKRGHKITFEPLVWRKYCVKTWKYWDIGHELANRMMEPPAQTRWRKLYEQRRTNDTIALNMFDELLESQQCRIQRMEKIARLGNDVKDMMLKQKFETPDDAPDVLARRYWADIVLGKIHRTLAIIKWIRVQKREMIRLEDVLGAYDLFVLGGRYGDLDDMEAEFDRLAAEIRDKDPDFSSRSTREIAVMTVKYLRSKRLLGNPNEEDYHSLRNNFITLALFQEPHSSLPIQSVAIYCAVARRLGINARPSNYPHHVHAVVEAPRDITLDGRRRDVTVIDAEEPERMHMDPWRSSEEVPQHVLTLRLSQMGAPEDQYNYHLGPTSNLEVALRTGRNVMNSVQETRSRFRGGGGDLLLTRDAENAWYSMLWVMLILGDSSPPMLHRRRQFLPYLIGHFGNHMPEDLDLIETYVLPMFESEREHEDLLHLVTCARKADEMMPAPSPRPKEPSIDQVTYKIGTYFKHKRYGYTGIIYGWHQKCSANEGWIEQMGVDRDLSQGRRQPFYNIIADDDSRRYVAQENIIMLADGEVPCEALMLRAGQYFKRWDPDLRRFISNVRDEFPDD